MKTTTDLRNQATGLLIIGDIVIDETWSVKATKLSPEGPVPVVLLSSSLPSVRPGGAGLAALYAAKSKIPVHLLTACSDKNKALLEESGIPTTNVRTVANVVKKRYIDASSGYHLLRVDNDEIIEKPRISTRDICPHIQTILEEKRIHTVMMLDYRKGIFFDPDTCQSIIKLCRDMGVASYVDTRCLPTKFTGADYIKLNESEYRNAKDKMGIYLHKEMRNKLEAHGLIVTLGKHGAMIQHNTTEEYYKPEVEIPDKAPDVTGCGDVFGVNFCHHLYNGIKTTSVYAANSYAVKIAVNNATRFAYQDTSERL